MLHFHKFFYDSYFLSIDEFVDVLFYSFWPP